MKDVAARAGVSAMTVSRVLHGDVRVAEATRARVEQAIADLAYRRDEVARSLRLGRTTGLLGLVVSNLANPFWSRLALGVEEVAEEHGLKMVLGNSGEDPARERLLVGDLAGRRVDGLIVVPAGTDQAHLGPEALPDMPVVLAGRPPQGAGQDCVLVDDVGGARSAVEGLLAAGHRRIGYLGNPPEVWTGRERLRGYREALRGAGVPDAPELVRDGLGGVAEAEEAAAGLLALAGGAGAPTALFCANNRLTVGAYRALRGAAEPPALTGFDDFELADALDLPITVVASKPEELGRRAAGRLAARLAERDAGTRPAPPSREVVPTSLISYGARR